MNVFEIKEISNKIKKNIYEIKERDNNNVSKEEIELLKIWIEFYGTNKTFDGLIEFEASQEIGNLIDKIIYYIFENIVLYQTDYWTEIYYSIFSQSYVYFLSFFGIKEYPYKKYEKNPFHAAVELWNLGLIASYDEKTWRLHKMSDNGKVVYEMKGE